MDKTKEQLKEIVEKNPDVIKRIEKEKWSIEYEKQSDMLIMGKKFPKNTSYFYVNGSGVMLRVDENKKIYGFAIENAKFFMKRNPEIGILFYPIVYPVRYFWLLLVFKFVRKINNFKQIISVSDFVTREACYA